MESKSNKKIRLDELLVSLKLASNIDMAKRLIIAGNVICNDQLISSPSSKVSCDSSVRFKGLSKYVGRGALKLEGAIHDFNLDESSFFKDKIILDIGASTGGFSDYCLQHGARYLICLDVGSNQLAWKLRSNPQVISMDHTNIKDFSKQKAMDLIKSKILTNNTTQDSLNTDICPDSIDIVLADISFNSLAKLSTYIVNLTQAHRFILLIKPQFELPRSDIPDGGIVKDQVLQDKATDLVKEAFLKLGAYNIKIAPSVLKGHSGNQESFIYFEI